MFSWNTDFFQVGEKNESICEQFQSFTGTCASKIVKPLDSFLVCRIVTIREIGLSNNQLKDNVGLKSRSTAISIQALFEYQKLIHQKAPGKPENLGVRSKF